MRYVAELRLGIAYGPDQAVGLIAATDDPVKLEPCSTWFMATRWHTSAGEHRVAVQIHAR